MSSGPSISVIMPAHNAAAYIDEAIQSVRNQSFSNWELIVVNDGSTDGTALIVGKHVREDHRVRVIQLPRVGISQALNQGIREANAELIARMDADDVACASRLEVQWNFMQQHHEIHVLGTGVWIMGPNGRIVGRTVAGPLTLDEFESQRASARIIFTHPTVMFRKTSVVTAGCYSDRYPAAEDYDLWNRMSESFLMLAIDEPLLCYRIHDQSAGTGSMRIQTESWARVRIDVQRRRIGLGPVTNDEFRAIRRGASLRKRMNREMRLRSRYAYRKGGAGMSSGKASGIAWLLAAAAMSPLHTAGKLRKQVFKRIRQLPRY